MANKETFEDILSTEEWWWVGSALDYMLFITFDTLEDQTGQKYKPFLHASSNGVTLVAKLEDVEVFRAFIRGKEKKTLVTVTTSPEFTSLWKDSYYIALGNMVGQARQMRRIATGVAFEEILDEYYARRSWGDKVKLIDLAERWRVNYKSLRQAKIRYDAEHNKSPQSDEENASDE